MRYSLLLICLLQLPGCSNDANPNHQSRLDAATEMNNVTDRNTALAKVAIDAAAAGEGEVVKKAVSAITVEDKKMRTARDSALALAKAGQGNAAVEVAKMISQVTMRDDTLKKIILGQ